MSDGKGGPQAGQIYGRDGGASRGPKLIDETVERGLVPLIRRYWKFAAGGVGFLFVLFLWWGFQPIHGGPAVGICRTFAELRLRYPESMRMTAVDGFKSNLRLYFTHIDDFGETRSEVFECQFNDDLTLSGAMVNNQAVDGDAVKAFNATIPQLLSASPDTTVPAAPGDDLRSLKQ